MGVQQETASQAGYNINDVLSFLKPLSYRFEMTVRKDRLKSVDEDSLKWFQNILYTPTGVN